MNETSEFKLSKMTEMMEWTVVHDVMDTVFIILDAYFVWVETGVCRTKVWYNHVGTWVSKRISSTNELCAFEEECGVIGSSKTVNWPFASSLGLDTI